MWHVSSAHKRVSKLLNFEGLQLEKTDLFDLADTPPHLRDDHWAWGLVTILTVLPVNVRTQAVCNQMIYVLPDVLGTNLHPENPQ